MKKIAIVGAGISGLYLANKFNSHANFDYKIFEKKENLKLDEGYGIQLSVNSIRLLNKIGFKNVSASDVYYPTKVNFFQAHNEKKICEINLNQFNDHQNRYTTLKRSTLIKFLVNNIPRNKITFGSRIENVQYNNKIKINHSNISEDFDYLIVADGAFSKLRSKVSNNSFEPAFNGNIAIRAQLKESEIQDISVFMGSNLHYVIYPVNQALEYNFVSIINRKLSKEEINDKKYLNSEVFLKSIKEILSKKTNLDFNKLNNIMCFPVYVSSHLPKILNRNTFLSGDALFTFPPSFAQGASQSIETSSGILNSILNSNNNYKYKIDKILMVNKRSRLNHFAFHLSNPLTVLFRNMFLKYFSKNKKFLESYLGKIYRD